VTAQVSSVRKLDKASSWGQTGGFCPGGKVRAGFGALNFDPGQDSNATHKLQDSVERNPSCRF
jgi:hypothetical protein